MDFITSIALPIIAAPAAWAVAYAVLLLHSTREKTPPRRGRERYERMQLEALYNSVAQRAD